MFVIRERNQNEKQMFDITNSVTKAISDQGFEVTRMKRVRKKESSVMLASQNIEDFLIPSIREYCEPLSEWNMSPYGAFRAS